MLIKWLSNYVVNHVLELFKIQLEKRHEENFEVAT